MKITAEDIKAINAELNEDKYPWVDESLLESALSSYFYYDTDLAQICSILRGLIKNHPFSNANKRTASVVFCLLMAQKGLPRVSTPELVNLVMDIAEHHYEVPAISLKVKSLLNI